MKILLILGRMMSVATIMYHKIVVAVVKTAVISILGTKKVLQLHLSM